jgi:hypothetical protein
MAAVNESPAEPDDAVWSVVRGAPAGAHAVDPDAHGIAVPAAVLAWAPQHGLDAADPEVHLMVQAADEAGFIAGQLAWLWHKLPDADMATLRAALAALPTH